MPIKEEKATRSVHPDSTRKNHEGEKKYKRKTEHKKPWTSQSPKNLRCVGGPGGLMKRGDSK